MNINRFWHWHMIDAKLHPFQQFAAKKTYLSRAEAEDSVREALSNMYNTPPEGIELVWEDRCQPDYGREEFFIQDKGMNFGILMYSTEFVSTTETVH